MHTLVKLTARQAVELLKKREVSPLELIDAALHRIEETDGVLNAMRRRGAPKMPSLDCPMEWTSCSSSDLTRR